MDVTRSDADAGPADLIGPAEPAALVLLASVLAISFNAERLQAISQRNAADSGALISESQDVSGTKPTLSILLSVAAWPLDQSPAARYAMLVAATHTAVPTGLFDISNPDAVAFSPDSRLLAVGDGNTVRLFDMATRREVGGPLTGDSRLVDSVAFSPDGTTLAAGGGNGTVKLWDVSYLKDTAGYLCALVGRSLTPQEWAAYVAPGPAYRNICP